MIHSYVFNSDTFMGILLHFDLYNVMTFSFHSAIKQISPSMCAVSMPFRSVLSTAGCMLNRLATKAKLSLLFPEVTSWGDTNCLQSSLAACRSISSALRSRSSSFTNRRGDEATVQSSHGDVKQTGSRSGRSCRSWRCSWRPSPRTERSGPAGRSRPGSPAEVPEPVSFQSVLVCFGVCCLRRTLMSSLKLRMVFVPAFCRW